MNIFEFSDHAKARMNASDISEEEVLSCVQNGELEINQIVKGEMRYGKKLELKDKTIIVIYTHLNSTIRIITTYLIRRKKWQSQK